MGDNASRFSDQRIEYKVLYAAADLVTTVRESIVGDNFDDKVDRHIRYHVGKDLACTLIDSTEELVVVDLTDVKTSNQGFSSELRCEEEFSEVIALV